ncbi:DUF6445 family protein [Chitinivorax sp. B]|uniref:DUF6445 family protein n=1 Tax=Chitinivorax sp. B TaxID=2502235 RepID=UPI0010F470AD|nr:DUF6445 family protein [Chitinivorax sp. B]
MVCNASRPRVALKNGQSFSSFFYNAQGQLALKTANSKPIQFVYNLRFPGQYWDNGIKLSHNWYRTYDPERGGYIQSDPIGLDGGLNTFAYALDNPIGFVDPYGLWVWGDPFPQGAVDFAAGFGDTLSFGATNWLRDQMDVNGSVNKCSSAYKNGEWGAIGLSMAFGGAHLGRNTLYQMGMLDQYIHLHLKTAMGEKKRRQHAPTSPTQQRPVTSPWLAAGDQAFNERRWQDALQSYQTALRQQPDLAQALYGQGLTLLEMQQGIAALVSLKQAAQMAPTDPQIALILARTLMAAGNLDAALTEANRLLAIDPQQVALRHLRGGLFEHQGKITDAIQELTLVHQLAPTQVEITMDLAETCYRHNYLSQAITAWQAAHDQAPAQAARLHIGYALPSGKRPHTTRLAPTPGTSISAQKALDALLAACDLHVIDDLLADSLAYRQQALALQFVAAPYAGQNYPGIQTTGQPCQPIMQIIADTLGKPIKFSSPDTGAFRISMVDSEARTDIHVDNEMAEATNQYAAVLYLNLPSQCQGGTTFWRHIETGWEARPDTATLGKAGYASFRTFQKRWLPRDKAIRFNDLKARRDGWQALFEIPMQHNRLVFYRSHFFHSISDVFGSDMEDGRLVQLFNFETFEPAPGMPG